MQNLDNTPWQLTPIPQQKQNWLDGGKHSIRKRKSRTGDVKLAINALFDAYDWRWPKRPIIFISDLHADGEALLASLYCCGAIVQTGATLTDFALSHEGKKALFIFGGDFFDKGPSNLTLLRTLYRFIKTGARIHLLAGNHDLRILYGMRCVGDTHNPRDGHFFIRMGAKAIPLLREIRDQYLSHPDALANTPDEDACRALLFPSAEWRQQFPTFAAWVMPRQSIARELQKIEKKMEHFDANCTQAGINLREAYAAAKYWQALFLESEGEFFWFFKRLRLVYRSGSFLFLHAGIDDRVAAMLKNAGTGFLNQQFKQQLLGSAFEFYYGPIANTLRTKYRDIDMPLTATGAAQAHQAGIHAIVHGHRNLHHGQRIALRKSLLHFECDITLDKNSRHKEGLKGLGVGATLFNCNHTVVAISNDYSHIKVLHKPTPPNDAPAQGDLNAK